MKRPKHYTLDERGEPVPCDLLTWAKMFEGKRRQVRLTIGGGLEVSTVFLGLDHNWSENGPAIIWETMVFAKGAQDGHELSDYQERCAGSREQAVAMHHAVCAKVWPQLAERQHHMHPDVP